MRRAWVAATIGLAWASGIALASDVPAPVIDYPIDRVIESFREPLRLKTPELLTTYVLNVGPGRLALSDHKLVACDGLSISPGDEVARIDFSASSGRDELIEVLRYTGCRGENVLTESVSTRGKNLQPNGWAEIQAGERQFALKPNETERHVRWTDSSNEELASASIVRVGSSLMASFSIQGKLVLTIQEAPGPEVSETRLTYYGLDLTINYRGDLWSWASTVSTPVVYSITSYRSGQTLYRVGIGPVLSYTDFTADLGQRYTNFQKVMTQVMGQLLAQLPPSSTASSSTENERLLEELRLMLIRVTNSTELEKVRVQVLEFIEAAKTNRLIDKRPAK